MKTFLQSDKIPQDTFLFFNEGEIIVIEIIEANGMTDKHFFYDPIGTLETTDIEKAYQFVSIQTAQLAADKFSLNNQDNLTKANVIKIEITKSYKFTSV